MLPRSSGPAKLVKRLTGAFDAPPEGLVLTLGYLALMVGHGGDGAG
jgi:hypothetical protein